MVLDIKYSFNKFRGFVRGFQIEILVKKQKETIMLLSLKIINSAPGKYNYKKSHCDQ